MDCSKCDHATNEDKLIYAMEQAKQGDKEAFSDIYNLTHNYVYQRAKYIVKDEQDAFDLMQEVYLALFKDINRIHSNESLYGWLKTVIFRQGLKMIEKKRKIPEIIHEDISIFESIIDDDGNI